MFCNKTRFTNEIFMMTILRIWRWINVIGQAQ